MTTMTREIRLRTRLTVTGCAQVFQTLGDHLTPEVDPGTGTGDDPPQLGAVHDAVLPVRMLVWDRGSHRDVALAARVGGVGSLEAAGRLLDRYVAGFTAAEQGTGPGRHGAMPQPACGGSLLPADIVTMMERYGRQEYRRLGDQERRVAVAAATQDPLAVLAVADPASFLADLAAACLPVGGWAVYGAERTVVNLLGPHRTEEAWYRLLDATIEFLRSNHVPLGRVPGYAQDRFVAEGGRLEDWLPFREPPDPGATIITPLAEGEVRCVVRGRDALAGSRVVVFRDGCDFAAGVVVDWAEGLVEGRRGDGPSEIAWKRVPEMYDLYLDIAWSVPDWEWAHPELEPFFPHPRPLI